MVAGEVGRLTGKAPLIHPLPIPRYRAMAYSCPSRVTNDPSSRFLSQSRLLYVSGSFVILICFRNPDDPSWHQTSGICSANEPIAERGVVSLAGWGDERHKLVFELALGAEIGNFRYIPSLQRPEVHNRAAVSREALVCRNQVYKFGSNRRVHKFICGQS